MISFLRKKIKEDCPQHDMWKFHCIIHQESLCKSTLKLSHVINPVVKVVNIIRSRPLAHRELKTLLEDIDVQYKDVLYHNSVRWHSHSKVLRRVHEFPDEIVIFLEIKKLIAILETT